MSEDYWNQVSQVLGIHGSLAYLPHTFVLVIRPFVRDCHGSQVLEAVDGSLSEGSLLIDEPWHLHILPPQNWLQSLCPNLWSYAYGI
jgi:hypothetical protein